MERRKESEARELPHHDGSPLYLPDPPAVGNTVRVRVRVPAGYGSAESVYVRSMRDGEAHYDEARLLNPPGDLATDRADRWEWWEAEVLLVNPVQRYRFLLGRTGPDGPRWDWLNAEGVYDRDIPDVHDFRLVSHRPAPGWVGDAVIYEVFPDRFARSTAADAHATPDWAVACGWETPVEPSGETTPRQFYGGDLDGITENLDHIAALGATVIYLTPFFPARSNHRYDASTFDAVDPLLGGNDALIRLVEAAHSRGLRVLGDLTANHSGDAHEWFRAARADPASPEASFYYFSADSTDYASWFGVPSLPKFNWTSTELRRRFITAEDSVVARWLRPPFNLDGWRIDVANMTGRHGSQDLNHEVAVLIADAVYAANPEALLLAESTGDAAADFGGDTWHGAMTYSNFTRPLWQWLAREDVPVNFFGTPLPGPHRISGGQFAATHSAFTAAFPWRIRAQNMNALNTHDTARAASVMVPGGVEVGLAMMFTLPGLPTLFAGDEYALPGLSGEDSRTPLPWGGRGPKDLRRFIGDLAALRQAHPALTEGSFRWLHLEEDLIVYVREHRQGCILVAAARASFDDVGLPSVLVHPQGAGCALREAWGQGDIRARWGRSLNLSGSGPGVRMWELPGVEAPEGR